MKVICSMVMSLDGFIADSNGATVSGPDDWANFGVMAKRYNNFVIGRGTNRNGGLDNTDCQYKVMVSTWPYDKEGFLHATSPRNAIDLLKNKVEIVYLVGGGKLNASFSKAKLIDELIVTVVPKVIGSGTKLFEMDNTEMNLVLLNRDTLDNGSIQITYKVKK